MLDRYFQEGRARLDSATALSTTSNLVSNKPMVLRLFFSVQSWIVFCLRWPLRPLMFKLPILNIYS